MKRNASERSPFSQPTQKDYSRLPLHLRVRDLFNPRRIEAQRLQKQSELPHAVDQGLCVFHTLASIVHEVVPQADKEEYSLFEKRRQRMIAMFREQQKLLQNNTSTAEHIQKDRANIHDLFSSFFIDYTKKTGIPYDVQFVPGSVETIRSFLQKGYFVGVCVSRYGNSHMFHITLDPQTDVFIDATSTARTGNRHLDEQSLQKEIEGLQEVQQSDTLWNIVAIKLTEKN